MARLSDAEIPSLLFDDTAAASVPTPAATYKRLFLDTDGLLKLKDSTGALTTLGSGIPATLLDAKGDLIVASAADTAVRVPVGADGTVLTADAAAAAGIKWAAAGGGGSIWTTVTKTLDESVANSATLQDDDHLFFTATLDKAFVWEAVLIYANPTSANGHLKVALGEDTSGARGTAFSLGFNTGTGAIQQAQTLTNQSNVHSTHSSVAKRMFLVRGYHYGGGGTFRVLWAQSTAHADAVVVYTGSILRYQAIN